ncbi:hypothetical protein [Kitasatospora sp. NPDC001132]
MVVRLLRGSGREVHRDPAALVAERLPAAATGFGRLGWDLPSSVDRVYVSERASAVLGYRPWHGVAEVLAEAEGHGLSNDQTSHQTCPHVD